MFNDSENLSKIATVLTDIRNLMYTNTIVGLVKSGQAKVNDTIVNEAIKLILEEVYNHI